MLPKYSMKLDWRKVILSGEGTEESPYVYGDVINVCLESMEVWLKANAGEHYCGNSADSQLTLWFMEEPSQEVKDAIQAKWDALDEESSECQAYMSAEERLADAEVKKASARAKLEALGLTEAEFKALFS
jgi:hypothetical protein